MGLLKNIFDKSILSEGRLITGKQQISADIKKCFRGSKEWF